MVKSTDSGATWTILDSLGGGGYHFWSEWGGLQLASAYEIDLTTDGGHTWHQLTGNTGFFNIVSSYAFVDQYTAFNRGYVLKDSLHWLFPMINDSELYVIRTLDGGASWSLDSLRIPTGNFGNLRRVGDLVQFDIGNNTAMFSTDFGTTWNMISAPAGNIIAASTRTFFTSAKTSNNPDTISVWVSNDSGSTWLQSKFPRPSGGLFVLDERHAWLMTDSIYNRSPISPIRSYLYTYHAPQASVTREQQPYPLSLAVYPDPATTSISLAGTVSPQDQIDVFDVMGRKMGLVAMQPLAGNTLLDLHGLPLGYYSVRVSHGQSVGYCRFLKLSDE